MCNCLKEAESKVVEHLKTKFSDILQVGEKAECVNQTMLLSKGKLSLATFNQFEVECIPIKKDGTLGKPRKVKMPVLHAYCPSCGQLFEEPEIKKPEDLTSGQ